MSYLQTRDLVLQTSFSLRCVEKFKLQKKELKRSYKTENNDSSLNFKIVGDTKQLVALSGSFWKK